MLPPVVRLTAIGLRLHADDQGRENANQRLLWASIWPLSEDVSEGDLILHLLTLEEAGYITVYSVGPRAYYQIVDWPKVDHGKPSRLPAPPLRESSRESNREAFSAVEGESEGEWREESPPPRTIPGSLPSPFCRAHPDGVDQPCRNCGTARLRHDREVEARRLLVFEEGS